MHLMICFALNDPEIEKISVAHLFCLSVAHVGEEKWRRGEVEERRRREEKRRRGFQIFKFFPNILACKS